jgi:YebC/PmpR family DNA-binding regulatory protein
MSGHSKWSTIKHKKEATDAARGKLFSKLAKAISVAVKTGGGGDPANNPKLRAVLDEAKDVNLPKENIERAIKKAASEGENLEEATYEGFGPGGFGVIVQVATDNRNRTGQEIKSIFERAGGRLAGPGAVAYNFKPKGLIIIKEKAEKDEQMLSLIDLGVEEIEEADGVIEAYLPTNKLSEVREKIKEAGFEVVGSKLVQKPKTLFEVSAEEVEKAVAFLEKLDDHDDVQKVFANVDF